MVAVPGGSFQMGSADGEPDERPVHHRRLQPFLLDRFEVTQAEYARCAAAGACRPARRFLGSEGPDLPAIGVSWIDAESFCRYAGKRLPTEAEWEWAARGADARSYPWGNELDCRRANFGNYAGAGLCAGSNPGSVLPVGSRPGGVSPFGAHDLAGNVWEWVACSYAPYPGRRAAEEDPLSSAAWNARRDWKVLRGGSCCSYFAMPRAANRLAFPPSYRDSDIGFRCARPSPRPAVPPAAAPRPLAGRNSAR